jgi:hypothetical protein
MKGHKQKENNPLLICNLLVAYGLNPYGKGYFRKDSQTNGNKGSPVIGDPTLL